AQAVIAPLIAHGQHVRVQIRAPAPLAGNGKGKAHQFVILAGIESADNLAADFVADHKHAQWNHVHVIKVPHFLLQGYAGPELIEVAALADGNPFHAGGGHGQFLSSRVLACCHKLSISSRFASSRVLPFARNCSSSHPKRRRNLRLVLRSADSGSTARYRAMFTSTKNRSPTSSSRLACSASGAFPARDFTPPGGTWCTCSSSSSVSSRSFSSNPCTSGQSKPTCAALELILLASINAGILLETLSRNSAGELPRPEDCARFLSFSSALNVSQFLRTV